jgi:hypothetical protein
VTIGALVWLIIGAALLIWLLVTSLIRSSLSVVNVFDWLIRSPLGRVVAFAGWAVAGWHLFCQRP